MKAIVVHVAAVDEDEALDRARCGLDVWDDDREQRILARFPECRMFRVEIKVDESQA